MRRTEVQDSNIEHAYDMYTGFLDLLSQGYSDWGKHKKTPVSSKG